jgi:hypothetical protein
MTLRVTIEIVPFGVEKDKQTIGVIDISNQGRDTDSDNFKYSAVLRNNDLHGVQQQAADAPKRASFLHRREDGALPCIKRAIEAFERADS